MIHFITESRVGIIILVFYISCMLRNITITYLLMLSRRFNDTEIFMKKFLIQRSPINASIAGIKYTAFVEIEIINAENASKVLCKIARKVMNEPMI